MSQTLFTMRGGGEIIYLNGDKVPQIVGYANPSASWSQYLSDLFAGESLKVTAELARRLPRIEMQLASIRKVCATKPYLETSEGFVQLRYEIEAVRDLLREGSQAKKPSSAERRKR